MTWPIPPLANTRTNDTPQFDTHPADHNAIANAIAELAGQVPGLFQVSLSNAVITTAGVVVATLNIPANARRRLLIASCTALGGYVIETGRQYQMSITTPGGNRVYRAPGGTSFGMAGRADILVPNTPFTYTVTGTLVMGTSPAYEFVEGILQVAAFPA